MTHKERELYVVVEGQSDGQKSLKKEQSEKVLPGFSTNKTIYLVLVEDPSVKSNRRAFVSHRVDYEDGGIKFNGYEVKYANRDKIKAHSEAYENAININDPMDIYYPGHRVISVRNVQYIQKAK